MIRFRFLVLAAFAVVHTAAFADDHAPSVVSAPVGYVATPCLGGSDTMVSIPFHLPPVWAGLLAAEPSSNGAGTMLSLTGDPEFTADQLLEQPHYLLVGSGSDMEGAWFEILGNDEDSISIDAEPADLDGVQEGDRLMIVPHWTLAGLLPPGSQQTVYLSEGVLLTQRGTELLFFDRGSTGVQLAPNRKFFLTVGGWLEVADDFPSAGEVVVLPGQMFVIRHPEGAPDTVFVAKQQVFTGAFLQPLRRAAGTPQDNALAPPRPVPVRLDALDLDADVFVVSPSTDPEVRMDELLVYDNAAAAINKQPSAVYFRTPEGWVRDAEGFPAADNITVDGAQGLVVRKAAGPDDATLRWLNVPRY